jgi:hypothetical protein
MCGISRKNGGYVYNNISCDKNQIKFTQEPPTYLSSKHVIHITMSQTYPGLLSALSQNINNLPQLNLWKYHQHVEKTDIMYITILITISHKKTPTYLSSKHVIYIIMSRTYPGYINRFRKM